MPIPCPAAPARGARSPGRAARARGWWSDALCASWQTSFRRTRSPGRAARARGWWSDALCASWQTSFRRTRSPGRAARARGWWSDALCASWQTSFRRTRSPGRAARARGWWNDALWASWQTSLRRTRSPGRAARARGWWNDAQSASFHHFRDDKEMVLAGRGVLHDVVGNPAVGHLVGALFHGHRGHRRHRVDAVHLDLGQLLDKGQNGVELAAEVLDLLVGDRDARQMRDAADGRGVDGHGTSVGDHKDGIWADPRSAL